MMADHSNFEACEARLQDALERNVGIRNENARLRAALAAIRDATIAGRVDIETLHDFCERVLEYSSDQMQLDVG
jgi:hypothetical protein